MAQTHKVHIPTVDRSAISLDDIKHITDRIVAEVRPYSVVPDEGIIAACWMTLNVIEQGIIGDLVECGVWRGGTSFAMLLAQRYAFGKIQRPVWMYDSFEGMDKPAPEDGKNAVYWYDLAKSGKEDVYSQNWCIASLEEVIEAAKKLDLAQHCSPVKGWYSNTMYGENKPQQIALLRVDCDWYEPCRDVYKMLVPRVPIGGVIMIDDYYVWEGCTLATHEYLAEHKLAWPIRSVSNFHGAWMVKRRT